ncbi:MAG: ABC transporter ATP-binding protein [Blautia sp.]|nr:ABC transporter ATP-binding protein [Blautia sp.]
MSGTGIGDKLEAGEENFMEANDKSNETGREAGFQSLDILIRRWKDGTFSEIIDDWKWIFSYSAKYKGAIIFYTLLGVFSTSMGLVSSVAGKYMIDIITGYDTSRLWIVIVIMLGSTIFSLVFSNVINRISTKLSIYINNDIQADIFDKIVDADWLAINKYSNGDVLNRFNGDIGTVSSNAISWLPTIIIAIYNFAATFFVIWHYDVIMALIAFSSAPFMLLMSRVLIKKQRDYNRKVREMSSNLMTFEVETFYNFDTIKSFGVAPHYSRKMRWWQEKFKDISLKYNMFSIKTNILMTLLGTAVQFLAFGYCLFRLWTHDISYGTMTLFLQQRSNLSGSFNRLVSIIPAFLNSSVSAHRIRELVELPKEVHISASSELDAFAGDGFEIRMKDVDFSYVEGKRVITQSAFKACPGEIVALVGPSGEGKTTMIRLILGLIRPEEGKTYLQASNGKQVEMNAETRHLFAYVPQGNTILSGTLAENMRIVKEDATDEEIIEAMKVACAWEFVEKLPDGINSSVGERGRGLSEGQAQRIAIARAVLRDAPILLLDEATSALDVTTERQVLRNIIRQHPNKTCIVTTHRPSVLNMCQRVYRVMETKVTELSEKESAKMAMDF